MKLDVKALALTFGILWGVGAMFLTGLANLLWPGYGQAFLQAMASVYPGYEVGVGLGQVVVGALYGVVDGMVAGALGGWLYNAIVHRRSASGV